VTHELLLRSTLAETIALYGVGDLVEPSVA
jgi:hypothetical protein